MARQVNRLSPRAITTTVEPGRHADGGGLYLNVAKSGARSWIVIYRWNGRYKEMGLGGAAAVSLAKARSKAAEARQLVADGIDPIEARRETEAVPLFGVFADAVIADLSPQWRNAKHKVQWTETLALHASKLRAVRVDRIATDDVLAVLKPIWTVKPETASRIRGRIERILDAAKARGFRSGENPARWRGHLDHLLAKRQKLTRGHHAALPFTEVRKFIGDLRERDAMAALALEFVILTAARSGEVRGATWSEIDLSAKVWTVPAKRMKAGREHRVPLSSRAVEILKKVAPLASRKAEAAVFPNAKGKPLSDAAFSALFIRMGVDRAKVTPHGFRSSFRDWAGEVSPFPRELAEAALAHVVGNQTERAYRRGDALEKRRKLMDAWGAFCEPRDAGTVVVPMTRKKG